MKVSGAHRASKNLWLAQLSRLLGPPPPPPRRYFSARHSSAAHSLAGRDGRHHGAKRVPRQLAS
jgi:hypothetical protein